MTISRVPRHLDESQLNRIEHALKIYRTEDDNPFLFSGLDEQHTTYLQVLILAMEELNAKTESMCHHVVKLIAEEGAIFPETKGWLLKMTDEKLKKIGGRLNVPTIEEYLRGDCIFNHSREFVIGAFNEQRAEQKKLV